MKSILQVLSFDLLSKALLGFSGILIIRYLPHSEYAQYTFAVSLVMVVTQAVNVSLNRLYIVGYERLRLKGSASSFLGFQLAGIVAVAIIALPAISYLKNMYWFILTVIIATCLSEFSKTFFQEKMRFIRFSIIELSRTLLIAIGVSMAILIYGHSMTAWQVLSIQGAAMLSLFAIVFKRRLDFGNLFNFRHARELLSVILRGNYRFLFSYFFLYSFFAQIDIFMLRTLSGDLSLATYGSAFRYYALIVLLLGSVHTVFLPTTQKIGNVVELNRLFKKYMKLVLLVAPVILVGAWASQWIIPWIDTGKYPQAVSVFRILAVSAILSIAFSPYVNVIMKFEHFRFLFGLIITAIALSVGLNLVLVPQLGAVGTAISTLISFAFVNGSTFVRARRVMRTRISELQLARAVGAKKTGAGAVLQIRGSQQSNLEKIHETKAISNKAQTEVERVGA